jgi:hypothetical protein
MPKNHIFLLESLCSGYNSVCTQFIILQGLSVQICILRVYGSNLGMGYRLSSKFLFLLSPSNRNFRTLNLYSADPVAIRSKAWLVNARKMYRGFLSRFRHGRLFLVYLCCVVVCVYRPCEGLITRPGSPTVRRRIYQEIRNGDQCPHRAVVVVVAVVTVVVVIFKQAAYFQSFQFTVHNHLTLSSMLYNTATDTASCKINKRTLQFNGQYSWFV